MSINNSQTVRVILVKLVTQMKLKKTTEINIEVPNFNEPLSTQYVFDQFKMLAGMVNGLDPKLGQLVTRDVLDKQVNELKTHMDDENASLKARVSKIEEENKPLTAVEIRSGLGCTKLGYT